MDDQSSQRLFRVIPVLLPGATRDKRNKLPDFLVRTTWVEFRRTLDDEQAFRRLVAGIQGQEPGSGQAVFEGEASYRGLSHSDVEHAPFFGREALTRTSSPLSPSQRHHLGGRAGKLQKSHAALTKKISALDTDISRELDFERKLVLEERRAERATERNGVTNELTKIENQLQITSYDLEVIRGTPTPTSIPPSPVHLPLIIRTN